MEQSRPYIGQFKQYAYVWKPKFGKRQERSYNDGNVSYVERLLGQQMTTEEVIQTFVDNQFHRDIPRYSYVKQLYDEFLVSVDLEVLKRSGSSPNLRKAALLDDRNDAKGSRDMVAGQRRLYQGAMNAAQLYTQLSQPVSTRTLPSPLPIFVSLISNFT
jgi:hypothetical protein